MWLRVHGHSGTRLTLCRSRLVARRRRRGLGTTSPVDSTARWCTPTSTPTTASGRVGVRSGCFNRPNRGSTTCLRSGSTRITPVVNRTLGVERRRDLNRGKPIRRPARLPLRESDQLARARAKASRPVLYASFEHSRHHGATMSFSAFHTRRNAGNDHPNADVNSASAMP